MEPIRHEDTTPTHVEEVGDLPVFGAAPDVVSGAASDTSEPERPAFQPPQSKVRHLGGFSVTRAQGLVPVGLDPQHNIVRYYN